MIDPITLKVVSAALDAVSMRHDTAAANIANADNTTYRPQKVSFEDRLDAARQTLHASGQTDPGLMVAPQLRPETDQAGAVVTQVHLDTELATLSQSKLAYAALTKGLSESYAEFGIAMGEGK